MHRVCITNEYDLPLHSMFTMWYSTREYTESGRGSVNKVFSAVTCSTQEKQPAVHESAWKSVKTCHQELILRPLFLHIDPRYNGRPQANTTCFPS